MMMERVGKTAVLVFSSTSVRMIVAAESDSIMQYSVINTPVVFSSFRCESRMENVIAFEVTVENLLAGLRPGADAEHVTMKLTKREAAQYLRVETVPRGGGVSLVQDLPVRVTGSAEMMRFTPPKLPPPTVALFLPAPRTIAAVVDRMKTLGKQLCVEADATPNVEGGKGATLTLGTESDLVHSRTFFRNLVADSGADAAVDDSEEAAAISVSCSVNAKDFAKTLHGIVDVTVAHSVQSRLAVVRDVALYVHVRLEDGTGEITVIHSIRSLEE